MTYAYMTQGEQERAQRQMEQELRALLPAQEAKYRLYQTRYSAIATALEVLRDAGPAQEDERYDSAYADALHALLRLGVIARVRTRAAENAIRGIRLRLGEPTDGAHS